MKSPFGNIQNSLRSLIDNPLFRRERRLLFRRGWISWSGLLVVLVWLAHLGYLLKKESIPGTSQFSPEIDDYLYYIFTVFHAYIFLSPSILLFLLSHYRLKAKQQTESLRLTRLDERQRLQGYLVPRYLLSLFVLLAFYFPLLLRYPWLYEYFGLFANNPNISFNRILEALLSGKVNIWLWHPAITLVYFFISLCFNFVLGGYVFTRTHGLLRAAIITAVACLLMEIIFYYGGYFWHGFDSSPVNSSYELLGLMMWPIFLYGLLMNYMFLSGPIIVLMKLGLSVLLWRAAVRRLKISETPVF